MKKSYNVIVKDYRGIWIVFSAGFESIEEATAAADYARNHGTQYNVNGERILVDIAEA